MARVKHPYARCCSPADTLARGNVSLGFCLSQHLETRDDRIDHLDLLQGAWRRQKSIPPQHSPNSGGADLFNRGVGHVSNAAALVSTHPPGGV